MAPINHKNARDLDTCQALIADNSRCGQKAVAWLVFTNPFPVFSIKQSVAGYCERHTEGRRGTKAYIEISKEEAEVLQVHLL